MKYTTNDLPHIYPMNSSLFPPSFTNTYTSPNLHHIHILEAAAHNAHGELSSAVKTCGWPLNLKALIRKTFQFSRFVYIFQVHAADSRTAPNLKRSPRFAHFHLLVSHKFSSLSTLYFDHFYGKSHAMLLLHPPQIHPSRMGKKYLYDNHV